MEQLPDLGCEGKARKIKGGRGRRGKKGESVVCHTILPPSRPGGWKQKLNRKGRRGFGAQP